MLGRRTAELHAALSSSYANPNFSPEPFTDHYRQAIYHSVIGLAPQTFQRLRSSLNNLTAATEAEARKAMETQEKIRSRFRLILESRIGCLRIRVHDDLHLSNIPHTGQDFVFIGFDGRADRSLSEQKNQTFGSARHRQHVAVFPICRRRGVLRPGPGRSGPPGNHPRVEFWSGYWRDWVSATFLKGYFEGLRQSPILPQNDRQIRLLLDAFLIERSLEEASRELIQRPDWVRVLCARCFGLWTLPLT